MVYIDLLKIRHTVTFHHIADPICTSLSCFRCLPFSKAHRRMATMVWHHFIPIVVFSYSDEVTGSKEVETNEQYAARHVRFALLMFEMVSH